MPVGSVREAAAWVDRVGLALVFPKDDLVLPSLWEAAGGADEYAERDEDGGFVRWTEPMAFVWSAKDELVARGLACGGKHLRGRASLVSLDVLPALVAASAPPGEPSETELAVVDVLSQAGPLTTRELPELLPGYERKRVRAALERLQRTLVVTNAGREETDGWPAIVVDLLRRRYAGRLRTLPAPDDARRALAGRVLAAAGAVSAVDVAAALGWRKAVAAAALESLGAPARNEGGVTVWTARRTRV